MYYTRQELLDAINELERGRHTIQNCEKMAAVYTVLDHMFPEEQTFTGYSRDEKPKETGLIGNFGDSEFLLAVSGKEEGKIWGVLDELMDALGVLEPKLKDSVLRKIRDI